MSEQTTSFEDKVDEIGMHVDEAIGVIGTEAVDVFTSQNFYIALVVFAVCWGLAFFICRLLAKYFTVMREPDGRVEQFSRRWYIRRAARLAMPGLYLVIFVGVSQFINQYQENPWFEYGTDVGLVWLCWVVIGAFIVNPVVSNIALLLIVPALTLQLLGWFDAVKVWLDQYSFALGEVEISAYTFFKGVLFATVVIWIGRLISDSGRQFIRRKSSLSRPTRELLVKLFDIALYAIIFVAILDAVGIDLTALSIFGGALGVGLGFGLQKVASNFVSGLILLTEKSIKHNNLVEMDDGVFGYVRKLGARATIVETFDGKEVMVPNEDFITSRVANLTHSSTKGRVVIEVGVAYSSDLRLAEKLILQAAESCDVAIDDEDEFKPNVFLREFGDSSINFVLTFWLNDVTGGRWRAKSDVLFAIWSAFKEHDIEIPFPQRDVHLYNADHRDADNSDKKKAASA